MQKTKKNICDIFEIANEFIEAKENGLSVIIPHVCNNANNFSGHFAQDIDSRYPEIKTNYTLLGKKFLSTNPGYVQFVDVAREPQYNRRLIIATMIAQNSLYSKNKRTINYAYLVKSMIEVKKFIMRNFNSENKSKILIPKMAFKHTGANWNFITALIQDIWHDIDNQIF